MTDFHNLPIFKELADFLKEKSFEILANYKSSKYGENWKYWPNINVPNIDWISKYWQNADIVLELSKGCKYQYMNTKFKNLNTAQNVNEI